MSDEFNYWAPEHYDIKVVSGSESACMKVFYDDIKKYPTRYYGTHVWSKDFNVKGVPCQIVIRRFKSKELCKIHTEYPPTYIREGKVL